MRLGLILFWTLISLGLSAQTGDEWSRVYLEQAVALYNADAREPALELVQSALEFAPESSDALGLKGLLLAQRPPLEEAVPYLEQALGRGSFALLKRSQVSQALAENFLRLRNYPGIIRILGGREQKSPEEWRLLHLAYDLSGQTREALSVLKQGQTQYPFWNGWLELLLRYPEAEPQLLSRLKKHRRETSGFSDETLDRIVRRLPADRSISEKLLGDLLSLGYSTPALELKAWELAVSLPADYPAATPAALARDYLTLATLATSSEGALREKLLALSSSLTGQAEWDGDRDGWPEIRMDFVAGKVKKWALDGDQNGLAEMEVDFLDGVVSRVSERQGKTFYTAEFEEYPFLKDLSLETPSGRSIFYFPPYQVAWTLLERPDSPDSLVEPLYWKWNNSHRTLDTLIGQAALADRYDAPGRLTSRSRLVEGEEVVREEDSNGDGRRDTIMEFTLGAPRRVWKDLDGDGRPDLLERTEQGGKVIWMDSDGDQVYDFAKTAGGWKVWDYNRDGEPDFRLLRLEGKEDLKVVSYRGRRDSLRIFPDWESQPWP